MRIALHSVASFNMVDEPWELTYPIASAGSSASAKAWQIARPAKVPSGKGAVM
jgi:hypothetical protein